MNQQVCDSKDVEEYAEETSVWAAAKAMSLCLLARGRYVPCGRCYTLALGDRSAPENYMIYQTFINQIRE